MIAEGLARVKGTLNLASIFCLFLQYMNGVPDTKFECGALFYKQKDLRQYVVVPLIMLLLVFFCGNQPFGNNSLEAVLWIRTG
jgi:hypothetical protein